MAVARLGYEIDSSGAVVAEQNLDDMAAAAKRAEVGSKRLTGGVGATGRALSGVTFNARMLVPQLSQIGQQFTATGQLGQAVAVQAADIGLAFGVVGTVIGTVAGVALPSLISAFSDGESGVKDFSTALSDANTNLDEYISLIKSAGVASDDYLSAAIKSVEMTSQASADLLAIARIETFRSIDALNESLVESVLSASLLKTQMADAGDLLNIETLLRGNITVWKENRKEVGAFISQLEDLNSAATLDEMYDAAIRVRDTFKSTVDVTGDMTTEQLAFWKSISQSIQQMEILGAAQDAVTDSVGDAEVHAVALRTAIQGVGNAATGSLTALESLEDPVRRAADAAADFFTNLFNASKVQAGIIAAAEARGGGRGGDPRQFGLDDTALNLLRMGGEFITSPDGAGGGAGGDGALDALVSELQTEREVIEAWRAEGMELLNNANAAELAALGGHNEAKLRLEQEYQERLAGIQDQSAGQTLDVYSGLFGNMAALAKAGGEKTFKVWKAFSIAQATIDSYRAYTQVLADPFFIGRPFLRTIAAGSVLASGLAQVASIQGTSLGGGGGGGAGSGTSATAGVTATGATAPQQTRAIISLQGGRSRFTVEEINDITRQLQEQSDDGVIIEGFTRA